jgi:hypothetical protein
MGDDDAAEPRRPIGRFDAEQEGLDWEVLRAQAMEMCVEDQWRRVGVDGGWEELERYVWIGFAVLNLLTDVCSDDLLEISRVVFAPCTIG